MMITSSLPLEINKIYNERNELCHFEYLNKTVEHYSIKIIRKVTREEFTKFLFETFDAKLARQIRYSNYFYEIQTD